MQTAKINERQECWTHSAALTKNAAKERNMAAKETTCANCLTQVEYRDVDGYPGYRVGSDGSVWTRFIKGTGSRLGDQWNIMTPSMSNGYLIVGLTKEKTRKLHYVHTLVLEAFHGKRPSKSMQACHFPDPSHLNNSASNLRWGTPSENNRHKEVQGTHQIGEKNPRAKLNEKDVILARNLHESGVSCKEIAKEFSVTDALIRSIVKRKCWKHV